MCDVLDIFKQCAILQTELRDTRSVFDQYARQFDQEFRNEAEIASMRVRLEHAFSSTAAAVCPSSDIADHTLVRRIYHQCALKLHPDKPTGDQARFISLERAYQDKDLHSLLHAAGDLVDLRDLVNEDDLQDSLRHLQQAIDELKDSLAWTWGAASPERQQMLKPHIASIILNA